MLLTTPWKNASASPSKARTTPPPALEPPVPAPRKWTIRPTPGNRSPKALAPPPKVKPRRLVSVSSKLTKPSPDRICLRPISMSKAPSLATDTRLPPRAGLGLKTEHFREVLQTRPDLGFFEVHAEKIGRAHV